MIFLICCHHQVGQGVPDAIEQDPAIFAVLGFGGLRRILLPKKH
jgi:hypothetical protein